MYIRSTCASHILSCFEIAIITRQGGTDKRQKRNMSVQERFGKVAMRIWLDLGVVFPPMGPRRVGAAVEKE